MGDYLAELFSHFDQEEQARIRAAEETTREMLAQGVAAARDRHRVAESLHDSYWLLQPESDARADSAGVVFVAYVNALWRKTDAARAECIHDFLAKVEELIEPVLAKYGRTGEGLIAELHGECKQNASQVRSMLRTSPARMTSCTEDSAAGSPQDGTDHADGHSEATDANEQSEAEGCQSGDANRPVISIQPPAVLDFTDSWRKRMRLNADRSAQYARHLGRNGPEVERQEELLKDARVWAAATLRETVSEMQNVRELKERVVKQTWDQFVPKHRYYSDFRLGYREFESALWEEGWPSLEDCALEAVIERADSAGSQAGRAARQRPPLEAVAEDEERREKAKQNLVRVLQSYINKLDNANARDAVRETEIFCDYARENYASRAEARLNAMPPMDPQELFEVGDLTERRDLTGLPTIGDVFELVKRVEVRRPEHWPDPIAYHPDDSLEMRGVLRDLTRRAHESFQWLLEEPWNAWFRPQIRECVTECVRATREEYELRLPILAVAGDPVGLAAIGSQGIGEGTIVNPFRQGAKEHPYLIARWDSRQKLWTLHSRPIDKQGKPDPYQSVLAGPEATRLFKEAARAAVSRLRRSRDPEIRGLAITLREPLYVWLDLMRTKERGFRRVPQLTSWRGGKLIEAFLESGAVPPDARLTENGSIGRLFEESATFWDDLVDLGFDSDGSPTVQQRPPRAEVRATPEPEAAPEPEQIGRVTLPENDSAAIHQPEPGAGLDFTSEAGRSSAVAAYVKRWTCSEAALARTATVDRADLSKWKKGSLAATSDKSARIEKALKNDDRPTPAPKRSEDF